MKADYLIWEPGPGYDLAKDALMATVTRPVDNTGCRSASGFRNGTHYMEIICTNMTGTSGYFLGVVSEHVTDLHATFTDNPQRGCWLLEDIYNAYHDGVRKQVSDLVHFRKKSRVGILLDVDAGRMSFFIDGKRFEHYVFQNMPKGPFWVFASFRGRGSSVQFNPQAVMPF